MALSIVAPVNFIAAASSGQARVAALDVIRLRTPGAYALPLTGYRGYNQ